MKTFKKNITVFVFMLSALTIKAQVFQEWVQRFSHPDSLTNTAVAVDASGCVYVNGTSSTFSLSGENIITIKYSPSGVQQWVAIFNNNGLFSNNESAGIAVDKNCNVYVTGHIFSNFSCDIVTIKYDSAGTEQWAMKYNSPANKCDLSSGIKADGAGNIYVSGASQNNAFDFDFTVLKYSTDGTLLWDRQVGMAVGSDDRTRAIALDANGNVYATGQTVIFPFPFNLNCATVKYNSAGVLQWGVQFDGAAHSDDDAKSIAVDADGNAVITGSSFNAAGNADYITVKYNPNGVQQWANAFDGSGSDDVANSVVTDSKGNVIITGGSTGTGTEKDFATIQYDKNGKLRWLQRFDGAASKLDVANAMAIDAQDNIYVTGQSQSGAGQFNFDYATIKYAANGELQWLQRFDAGGFDQAVSISLDASNNVYVTGNSLDNNTIEFATVKYGTNLIKVNNGILEFKNQKVFIETLLSLENKDERFLDAWEGAATGFVSMRTVFNQIVDAEIKIADRQDSLPPKELKKLENKPIEHSPIARKNMNMLIISTTDDGGGFFDKNIHTEQLSALVNKDGIVIIADTIYQHTKDKIKMITDGDLAKIHLMIRSKETIANKKIIVNSIPLAISGSFSRSCQNNNGRFRIIVYEDFIQNTSTFNPSSKATSYRGKVRSLQRRVFGLWYDNYNAFLSLSGNHVGNIVSGFDGSGHSITNNYSGSYNIDLSSEVGKIHTLPYTIRPDIITQGNDPVIFQSTHTGTAIGKRTVRCTTINP